MHRTTTLLAATALTLAPLATLAVTAGAADATPAPYRVTISVNDSAPVVGETVKVKGTVKPAAPGQVVRLQVRYADRKQWKTLDTAKLSAASKYKFKDEVGSVRKRSYRVVKPASGGHAGRTSPKAKVTSYGWRSLTSLEAVASNGISKTNSVSINGTAYADSLQQYVYNGSPNPGTTGYNLNRGCLQFRGRVGLSDSSPVGGTAAVTLANDGVQQYAGTFGLTQGADVAFSVANVFRLTVSSTSVAGGLGAVGSPEVLCNF